MGPYRTIAARDEDVFIPTKEERTFNKLPRRVSDEEIAIRRAVVLIAIVILIMLVCPSCRS